MSVPDSSGLFRFGADATTAGIIQARKLRASQTGTDRARIRPATLAGAVAALALTVAAPALLLTASSVWGRPRTVDEVIASGNALASRAFRSICRGCEETSPSSSRPLDTSMLLAHAGPRRKAARRHLRTRVATYHRRHHRRRRNVIWLAALDGSEWRCVRVRATHAWCTRMR